MKKCCICNKKFEGLGNNPYPIFTKGVCCDECNSKIVIPIRIEIQKIKEEERNKNEDSEKK